MADNRAIGVYDSGLGGLSIWRELRQTLPHESLLYLGDGKNCPYGSRSKEEVCRLADEAVKYLLERGCKMVVVACNTATAAAIDLLRESYPEVPIVGLEPAVKPACLSTQTGVVGVLATERSLDGELFRRTAAKYSEGVEVITAAGRGFVEAVEHNREDSPETEQLVREAMGEMLQRGADRVVLGCTHYPFLRGVMERVIGEREVKIIDSSEAVARRVGELLDRDGLRAADNSVPHYEFRTFADEEYRKRLMQKAMSY